MSEANRVSNIRTVEDLEEKLRPLMYRWHECTEGRGNNDGKAGNTIEDLLGLDENNFSLPDWGTVEIKTQESETGSLLTLFHKEPSPRASTPKLLKALGWKHSEAGQRYPNDERSFRSTTYGHRHSVRGFKIEVEGERLYFRYSPENVAREQTDRTDRSANYGIWADEVEFRPENNYKDLPDIYYELADIKAKFCEKLDHTLLLTWKKKTENGKLFFYYQSGLISKSLQFESVLQALQNGTIALDFDARTRHNHGTKFRIQKNNLIGLFDQSRVMFPLEQ